MLITVVTFGDLTDILGKELTIELYEGGSIRNLLSILSEISRSPEGQIGEFRISEEVGILVDGRGIQFPEGSGTILRDGATVFLLLPFAGG